MDLVAKETHPSSRGGWEGDGAKERNLPSGPRSPIPTASRPIANVAGATFPSQGRDRVPTSGRRIAQNHLTMKVAPATHEPPLARLRKSSRGASWGFRRACPVPSERSRRAARNAPCQGGKRSSLSLSRVPEQAMTICCAQTAARQTAARTPCRTTRPTLSRLDPGGASGQASGRGSCGCQRRYGHLQARIR